MVRSCFWVSAVQTLYSTLAPATASTPQCSRAIFPRNANCTGQREMKMKKVSAGSSSRNSSSAHTHTQVFFVVIADKARAKGNT